MTTTKKLYPCQTRPHAFHPAGHRGDLTPVGSCKCGWPGHSGVGTKAEWREHEKKQKWAGKQEASNA